MEHGKNFEALVGEHIMTGIELGQINRKPFGDIEVIVGCAKFTLDGVTYIAIENPDDGYRSWIEALETTDEPCKYKLPDTRVVCTIDPCSTSRILNFIDAVNGETFLRIGTAYYDDWYPYCVFDYTPENLHYNKSKA